MKTSYMLIVLLAAVTLLFWQNTGCKKNPVGPPGPRELTWTVDTLDHPDNWQTLIYDVWASSAKDVYVAGDANTTHGILWHYDGRRWSDVKISITQGGPIVGPISFDDIYGFGPNDVWFVGTNLLRNQQPPPTYDRKSLIVHYDGSEWREIPTPPGNSLTAVWGPAPDDIWFGGLNGTLFHYDGVSVKRDTIPLAIPPDANPVYNVLAITGNVSETYMLLADFNSRPNRYFLLELRDKKWVIQDSTFYYNSTNLWLSPWGTLYAPGESTHYRRNGLWEVLFGCCNTLTSFGIHGVSMDNYFLVGRSQVSPYPGIIYHFNGQDWTVLKELEKQDQIHYDIWTDGREVFIVTVSGNGSMVYHGK